MIWLKDATAEPVKVRVRLIVFGLMMATLIFFCTTAIQHAFHIRPTPGPLTPVAEQITTAVLPGPVHPVAQKVADLLDQHPEEWEPAWYGIYDRKQDIMVFLDSDPTKNPDTVNPLDPGNLEVSIDNVDLDGFTAEKCSQCNDGYGSKTPTADEVVVFEAALRWQQILLAKLAANHNAQQHKAVAEVMKAS